MAKVMTGGKHARVCRACLKPIKVGETYTRIDGKKYHGVCAWSISHSTDSSDPQPRDLTNFSPKS